MKKKVERQITISLIELLKKYDYEKITITDICKHVSVSRQTFYTYYHNKDEVIKKILDYILEESLLNKIKDEHCSSHDYVSYMVDLYDAYDDFFIALEKWSVLGYLSRDNQEMIKKLFKTKAKNKMVQQYSNYYYLSFFTSVHSICMEWIRNGKLESKNEIKRIIIEFVFKGKDINILT